MIKVSHNIWVGDSNIDSLANFRAIKAKAILNVAYDLKGIHGWPGIEYTQVGLIDGPGNAIESYYAAILALSGLLRRHPKVIVYDHSGGRAMVVTIMYLNLTYSCLCWDAWISLMQERVEIDLPSVNLAHIESFGKINWTLLRELAT